MCYGYEAEGEWIKYDTPRVFSLDIPFIKDLVLRTEEGGTISFINDFEYNVPSSVLFYHKKNSAVCADKIVGDLMGVAHATKYYEDKGKISTRTVAEVLDSLLNKKAPIKMTTESIGVLSTDQTIGNVSVGILANPPASLGDVIIDRYIDNGASYLCFYTVENVQGGESDAVMTLKGAGNLYVGGGSASVSDRAICDGNGKNIADTYETKKDASDKLTDAQAMAREARSIAESASNAANSAYTNAGYGISSASMRYEGKTNSIGKVYLDVVTRTYGVISADVTDALISLIGDFMIYG